VGAFQLADHPRRGYRVLAAHPYPAYYRAAAAGCVHRAGRRAKKQREVPMPRVALPEGASVHCTVDDFLWAWDDQTPVLMMHGFARNALFWNRWVPTIAETHRVYRPDLLGCGLSDQPPLAIVTPRKQSARKSSWCSMHWPCHACIGWGNRRAG
jgi:pimeloyl-ACP methyl ester carboxylesterase